MLRYLLKRILLFFPIFLLISMLIFGLSKATPGDPAERLLLLDGGARPSGGSNSLNFFYQQHQQEVIHLGLDKPAFYFSIMSFAYPDSLFKINQPFRKKAMRKLLAKHGNWTEIDMYFKNLTHFESQLFDATAASGTKFNDAKRTVIRLFTTYNSAEIERHFLNLKTEIVIDSLVFSTLNPSLENLQNAFQKIAKNETPQLLNFPKLVWYGFDNQYHNWLRKLLTGNFGISLVNGQSVSKKIGNALFWTLIVNGLALFFTYLIAIPIGVYAAKKVGSQFDFYTSFGAFMLYSLPVFWVGTMLLTFLATPDFGLHWFNTGLCNLPDSTPFFPLLGCQIKQLILPIFCLTFPSLAFLIRQMRGSMLIVLKTNYIQTAAAKGLQEKPILWKHAFRNALFPIITIFATIFPRMVAGSVIVEVIFNLPGMGWLLLESIRAEDYPVFFVVLLLSAALTMIGILVADILYIWADPRVAINNEKLIMKN